MKGALAVLSFHSFHPQSLLLLLITEGSFILAPGASYHTHLAQILLLLASQTGISGPISVLTNVPRKAMSWLNKAMQFIPARKLMISIHTMCGNYVCETLLGVAFMEMVTHGELINAFSLRQPQLYK